MEEKTDQEVDKAKMSDAEVDQLMQDVVRQCTEAQEQFNVSLDQFISFLEMRKQGFNTVTEAVRDSKLATLKRYKESPKSPPPVLLGGSSCGFVPSFNELLNTTSTLITTACEPVRPGMTVPVDVIGGLDDRGEFLARLLPDETYLQALVLENISKCLLNDSVPPLLNPVPGMACSANYAQDGVWYRGRIVSLPTPNSASVFFVDFGNTEEIELSSLAPLQDKYQVFPPQMIRCCLEEKTDYPMPREAKWLFTDLVHKKALSGKLVESIACPPEQGGECFIVKLLEPTEGEPFDIGASVLAKAEVARSKKDRNVKQREQSPVAQSEPTTIPSQPTTSLSPATSPAATDTQAAITTPEPTEKCAERPTPQEATVRQPSDSPAKGSATPPAALPGNQSEEPSGETEVTNKLDKGKPLALIRPLAPEASSQVQGRDIKHPLNSLHPAVKSGATLEVVVTTDLATDGTFWARLDSPKNYKALFKELQKSCQQGAGGEGAAGFLSEGQLCCALFSEDNKWYRARVESSSSQQVSVRYLDYGNTETVTLPKLLKLKQEFAALPGLAFQCSISTSDHTSFNKPEIEKFYQLLSDEQPVKAKITDVKDEVASVELTLVLKGSTIDINEEIYVADTSRAIKTQTFTLADIPSLDIAETSSLDSGSWADQMDSIASPVGEGLTLDGSNGRKLKSQSPAPHESRPTRRQEERLPKTRAVVRGPSPIATHKLNAPVSTSAVPSQHSSRSTSPSSARSTPRGRASPRLDIQLARGQILSGLGRGVNTPTGRGRPAPRGPTPVQPGHTPSVKKPSERSTFPSTTLLKLYIKNVPVALSKVELVDIFSKYGQVIDFTRAKDMPSICFLTMSRDDTDKVMVELNGKPLLEGERPLRMEEARDQSSVYARSYQ